MNLAEHVEALVAKGFTEERAEIIVLMREAAIVLFDAFPDTLLLVGGASLILFEESIRHSSDLDIKPVGVMPTFDALKDALEGGLKPLSELLGLSLIITIRGGEGLVVRTQEKQLFTIDNAGLASVITTNTDVHRLEATGTNRIADVRSPSRDQFLLMKAETFLRRSKVKARDAYDIMGLLSRGAEFSGNLKQHLDDFMMEFDSETIQERIALLTPALCRADLETFIPDGEYHALEELEFKPLRDAVSKIFVDWI
jgi:hypothetical protein